MVTKINVRKTGKNIARICECEEVEKKNGHQACFSPYYTLKEQKGDTTGEDSKCKVENSLKGKPVIILCEYIANFEIMVRKAKKIEMARNR